MITDESVVKGRTTIERTGIGAQAVLTVQQFENLIPALHHRSYEVIGPVLREGAIIYDVVEKLADLPAGWTDEQRPGHYRVKPRQGKADADALFGYAVGPQSWKRYLHPSEVRLFSAKRQDGVFQILNNNQPLEPSMKRAFLGVRGCELAAIAIQDRVLLEGKFKDSVYQHRRPGVFIVAVNCTQAASTCFCTSMGTGPGVRQGFDLAVTELTTQRGHQFVIKIGSEAGAEVLSDLEYANATPDILREAEDAIERNASRMQRHMNTNGIRELLYNNFDHPRWDNVAQRCLTCANCTMVCPTCFCTTVEDVSDVTGGHAERWRKWDSCFSQEFSYIHGGSVRSSAKSRYRQWMTHKLASWIDQFGTSGCVGCGRCITWCPVGIDITEEVHAMQESQVNALHPAKKEEHGRS
ncbi:MAG TPA: 4Fe-4S dicluster domain-containing protein [Terriglobales bacterium]|nr:4Fe-4S dicluster domain-containing protein [Terriglobales bacterium]